MLKATLISLGFHVAVFALFSVVFGAADLGVGSGGTQGAIFVNPVISGQSTAEVALPPVPDSGEIVAAKSEDVPVAKGTPVNRGGAVRAPGQGGSASLSLGDFLAGGKNPAPTYPLEALERGWEGEVKIAVEFTKESLPPQVALVESSGFDVLDEEALKTAELWQLPEQLQPQANRRFVVPVEFKLVD